MHVYQRIWHYLQQHRVASIVVGHVTVVGVLGLLLLGNGLGMNIFGAFAQSSWSSSDHTYMVISGDTLGGIAARYRTTWQRLASYNHIANANVAWVLLGVSVTFFYIFLQSGMYVTSFRAISARLSWSHAIELFLKRNFLSVFLPAGGISSLAYSPTSIRREGLTKMQIHQASGIYAFVGLLTVFIVGVPVLIYSFFQSGNPDFRTAEGELFRSIDKIMELYYLLMLFITEIRPRFTAV